MISFFCLKNGSVNKVLNNDEYVYTFYLFNFPFIKKKNTKEKKYIKIFGVPLFIKFKNSNFIEQIVFYLIKKLQPYFRKDAYILMDNLYEKNASCIDTYSLFLYLKSHGYECYYVLWAQNPLYKLLRNKNQLDRIIVTQKSSLNSHELTYRLFSKLLRAKYTILSFRDSMHPSLERFIYNNKYIFHVGIGHGPVFLKTSVLSTPYLTPDIWNLYLVSSNYEEKIFCEYGWPKNRIINIGLPRFDWCRKIPHRKKNIFIMFTWRLQSFRDKSKDIRDSMYYKNFLSFINNKKLNSFIKKYNINIVISIHHAFKDLCNIDFKLNDNFELADSNNLIKYINTTDLFITDYSSIFHDFMFLNVPIIFYRLDYNDPWLSPLDLQDLENCRTKDRLLFNVFYNEEDVIDKILYYIHNDFKIEKEFNDIENSFFTEKSNICEKFVSHLECFYNAYKRALS